MVWGLSFFIAAGYTHDPEALAAALIALIALERRRLTRRALPLVVSTAVLFYLHGHFSRLHYERTGRLVAHKSNVARNGQVDLKGYVRSFPVHGRFRSFFTFRTSIDGIPCDLDVRARIFTISYGESLTVSGKLRTASEREELLWRSRGLAGAIIVGKDGITHLDGKGGGVIGRKLFWPLHESLRKRITRRLGARSGFPLALLLGERSLLAPRIKKSLSELGIMHLFALSGLHLGMIAAFLYLCLGRGRIARLYVVPLLLYLYVGIVGGLVSLVRAYTMVLLAVSAWILGRSREPIGILGSTLFLILLFDPPASCAIALQLSFAATFGIIAVARSLPSIMRYRSSRCGYIVQVIAVGVSAQLFTLPLLLAYFGKVSAVAPVATLVFLPGTVLIIASTASACLVEQLFAPFSPAFFSMVAAITGFFEGTLRFFHRHAPHPLHIPAPDAYLYYSGLLIFLFTGKRFVHKLVGVGLVAASFLLPAFQGEETAGALIGRILR